MHAAIQNGFFFWCVNSSGQIDWGLAYLWYSNFISEFSPRCGQVLGNRQSSTNSLKDEPKSEDWIYRIATCLGPLIQKSLLIQGCALCRFYCNHVPSFFYHWYFWWWDQNGTCALIHRQNSSVSHSVFFRTFRGGKFPPLSFEFPPQTIANFFFF